MLLQHPNYQGAFAVVPATLAAVVLCTKPLSVRVCTAVLTKMVCRDATSVATPPHASDFVEQVSPAIVVAHELMASDRTVVHVQD